MKNSKAKYQCVYLAAFFSVSLQTNLSFVIPLWAISLDATPFQIGLAISAVSILPIIFSFSFGSLIDWFGPRKILLLVASVTVFLMLLYPVFSNIWALIILQLIVGIAQSVLWIGAQTAIVKVGTAMKDSNYLGKFSIATNLGLLLGPLVMGVVWDNFGPTWTFVVLALWILCIVISSLFIPRVDIEGETKKMNVLDIRQFMPKLKDFKKAMLMLLIPMILLSIFATILRFSLFGIRNSFFVVYLEQIPFTATTISVLFAVMGIASVISAFTIKFLRNVINDKILLPISSICSLIPLTLPPLFTNFGAFIILVVISGFFAGIALPLMVSILSDSVDKENQGLALGLREVGNRLAAALVPSLFGASVHWFGLSLSFFIIGGLIVLLMVILFPVLVNLANKEVKNASIGQ